MPIERQSIPGIGTIFTKKVSFTTTATTVAVSVDGINQVSPFGIVRVEESSIDSGDGSMRFTEVLNDKGLIEVGTDGTVLVERGASGTSALSIVVTFIGLPSEGRHFITGYGKLLRIDTVFSTTDETVEVDCGGLDKIRVIGLVPNTTETFDAQDQLFVDEVVDSKGYVQVPSSGTITIRRPASGSSALSITVYITDGDTARIPGMGTIFSSMTNFVTTGTTVEVDAKGYSKILILSNVVFGTPVGTIDVDDGNLYVNETLDDKGVFDIGNSQTFTLLRAASGTSGVGVLTTMIGI